MTRAGGDSAKPARLAKRHRCQGRELSAAVRWLMSGLVRFEDLRIDEANNRRGDWPTTGADIAYGHEQNEKPVSVNRPFRRSRVFHPGIQQRIRPQVRAGLG